MDAIRWAISAPFACLVFLRIRSSACYYQPSLYWLYVEWKWIAATVRYNKYSKYNYRACPSHQRYLINNIILVVCYDGKKRKGKCRKVSGKVFLDFTKKLQSNLISLCILLVSSRKAKAKFATHSKILQEDTSLLYAQANAWCTHAGTEYHRIEDGKQIWIFAGNWR